MGISAAHLCIIKQTKKIMRKTFLRTASAGLILFISTLTFTTSQAQINDLKKDHLGFAVGFGYSSNKISSNFSAIDKMKLTEEGGSIGLLWGNNLVETKIAVGFYYSSPGVPHTVDRVNVETSLRYYPLNSFQSTSKKITPYLTTGLSANNYKLYGFYAGTESQTPNYSIGIEPYIGSVTGYIGSVGAGIELNLLDQHDFVKLFSEVNYNSAIAQKSSDLFKDTRVSNQMSINVGISFGINRLMTNKFSRK